MIKHILLFAAVSLLAACSTTNVGLNYAAPASVNKVSASAPPIFLGTFLDQRGESPTWLGAIRGGFGNPVKTLNADRPVADMVKAAFADGLRARGATLDQTPGQYQITGVVKKLDCNQFARRDAHADIEIAVLDKNGQQRFARRYTVDKLDGSILTLEAGIFGSIEELRALLEKTLREAVDQALDDSAFRAALKL